MTSVANAISSLLYTHDAVIVPGLGAFLCHAEGAKVNVITNQFEKPSATLSFDPMQREENVLVVNYLVANDGITFEEARQLVMEFVSDTFAQLKAGEKVEIPGVGTLSYGDYQKIEFLAVDSNNFNGDAFGLEDFTPKPVYGTDRVTLNTGSETPDERPEKEEHDRRRRKTWWIWVLLLLLLAAAAGGVYWWYFKPKPPVTTKPWPRLQKPRGHSNQRVKPVCTTVVASTDTLEIANDTLEITNDTLKTTNDTLVSPVDTIEKPVDITKTILEEPPTPKVNPVEVVKPEPASRVFIVGGCFSVEQNALKMLVEVREQGCAEAFVMKRGSKFYVCYGQYPSTAEAKKALPEVWSNYNKKAWIMKK
ncbi:MAG: hypothetical protein II887_00485 [Bacteroidales bacterium]|nr:hypothetical protein [Bacteroidales bacterium]